MDNASPETTDLEAWVKEFTATLRSQRESVRQHLVEQQSRIQRAGELLEREFGRFDRELCEMHEEIARLRAERDEMAAQLANAAPQSAKTIGDREISGEDKDFKSLYEMSLDDLRQAKDANSELQQQLAKARSTTGQQSRFLDWESEKQRILAALETDSDQDDRESQNDRLKVSEVLRTTEEVVTAKDREIQELKARLEEQSVSSSAASATTALVGEMLNSDAEVKKEVERLRKLQEEWQEKLRKAEVEIAVERAKIARQLAEMEQQRQPAQATPPKPTGSSNAPEQNQGTGRRWLSKLGLTNADIENERHMRFPR